jgi:hypothetical protein
MDFSEEFDGNIARQYTTRMVKMLNCCPGLEDLHLFPWHPTYLDTTQIFELGHWPCLKRFTLRRMRNIGPQYDVLNRFISAHPKIERLFIDTDDYEATDAKRVWVAGLPHLKALHVGLNWDMNQILNPSTTRNLEFLSTVKLSPDSKDEHLKILAQIPTLRYLVIDCPHPSPELLGRLAQAVPWIERLQFRLGTYRSLLTVPVIETDQDEVSFLLPLLNIMSLKVKQITRYSPAALHSCLIFVI